MNPIQLNNSFIHQVQQDFTALNQFIATESPSTIFILVDDQTMENCYPYFIPHPKTSARIEVIEIDHGEEYKNIETCTGVWSAMIELGCDRNSLVINLGGGVITDLGGFVASTIKRGISFIHIPTSLLGMVDAAIGGKNGVDIGSLKNQIGVINPPVMTIIDPGFLKTLSQQHLVNGSIEMFKHGLIADRVYWNNMNAATNYHDETFEALIYQSVIIKSEIVRSDPYEKGARKALNYGHTIGHAIESYCMDEENVTTLLHGEAIAAGLLLESYLSNKFTGLPSSDYDNIKSWYNRLHLDIKFDIDQVKDIIAYMQHDKKNVNGEIRFVLLEQIGTFITDQVVPEVELYKAFQELG